MPLILNGINTKKVNKNGIYAVLSAFLAIPKRDLQHLMLKN